MKVTLYFKDGRTATFERIGEVGTIDKDARISILKSQLPHGVLAYDSAAVAAVVIEEADADGA